MLSATIGLTDKTTMKGSSRLHDGLPVISLDNQTVAIVVMDPDTAIQLASLLTVAAAERANYLEDHAEDTVINA